MENLLLQNGRAMPNVARPQWRVPGMRGESPQQTILFSYRSVEDRIPVDHPLRVIRQLVEPVLRELPPI